MKNERKTKKQLVEELESVRDECVRVRDRLRALEMAVESMQLGVTVTDTEGKILYTNPAEARMHGYSVEELIGKDAGMLAPEEYRRAMMPTEMKKIKSWTREGVNIRKDRTVFNVNLMSDVVTDEKGDPVAIITTCEDITDRKKGDEELRKYREDLKALVEERTREVSETADRLFQEVAERKRMEKQLAESHERMLAVMDSLAAGVYVTDMDTHEILYANRRVRQRFGDVVGKTCWRVFQEGLSGPCEFCTNEKLLAGDGRPAGVHTWEFRNTVTGKWVELRDQAIRWIDGRIVRMEIATDISKRKSAEQALRESEEKFRSLVEQSLIGIYIIQDGRVKYANPKAADIFGYTADEILSQESVLDLILESDRPVVEENIGKRLRGEVESIHYTVRGKRKDGIPIDLEVHGTLTRFEGRPAVIGTLLDITERKRMDEYLRLALKRVADEKAKSEAIIDAMGDGVSIQDRDYRVLYQNRVHKSLVGDHKGGHCYRAYQRKDHVCKGCHVAMSFEDGKIHKKEQVRKTEKGTFYYEIISSPLRDSKGDIVAGIEAVRDITARKEVENALRESEEKFRALAEEIPNMIFINKEGKVVYVNKKCEEITGYTKDELCLPGFDIFACVAPESRDLARANFSRHMKGEEIAPSEYVFVAKSGKKIDTILMTKFIQFEGERAILGIATDISGLKEIERALRNSEERYRSLVNLSPDAIGVEVDGKVVFINSAGARMLGAKQPEEIIGRPILDFVHPDYHDIVQDRVRQMKENGRQYPFMEGRFRTLDGSEVDVEVADTTIVYQNRPAVQIIFRNITERKKTAEERERMIAELREALASIRTLTGLLPICASCKKIRDDKGYWNQIEAYIRDHTDADFSHSICPECRQRIYPGL